jgi:hypothetical protein
MMNDPESIAREYFSRLRKGDIAVLELFHDDAVLQGLGMLTRGKEAIREFYTNAMESGGPQPSEPVTLLSDETKAIAEVNIALRAGGSVHAIDLFEIEGGRIRSLTYFIADHPAD